ncbi:MAG: RagB/SusD family nutrient uptake outer membrane protein [Cytophagales bacterium CG18_big_fil_WC_8_21_14_2_50_42_9]|nr:MAG: RagB/SusD family nutrient uptake outer membrane protein [Cytophagales bacterium CG18_big_fil_WC_8_21_14_2_50_42_9]
MNKKFKYIFLLLSTLTASSCKDYLEQAPDQRASLDSVEDVAELLVTAYPQANYITFTEAMSDNADDKGAAAGGGDPINRDPWYFEDVRGREEDTPDFYWNACYKAIAAANQALAVINTATNPEEYSGQKGEALVARAYAHFMLVSLFSKMYDPATAVSDPGIPYVTEPENVVIKQYERKTVAYVYEQIEKDLTEGLPLLNGSQYNVPKYHFTTAAAHAFASRFYLFKKEYDKVVAHANAVFVGGNILPNLRPINDPAYRAMEYLNREANYTEATNPANILLAETRSIWGRSFASYRYGFTFDILNETIWSANVAGGQWGQQLYGQNLSLRMPKFREHFVRESQNANFGDPYNIIPLFTAEEVLFNRAEANAWLGNTAATLKDLNDYASTRMIVSDSNPVYDPETLYITTAKIRSFYRTTSVQQGLLATILDFKRVEFLFEGLRWFDLMRYNIPIVHTTADNATTITLGPDDPRRVFQIPQEATLSGIALNPR